MPQTTYLDDPTQPGTCKNCHHPKDTGHSGPRFADPGDVCNRSRAYVWRILRAEQVPAMQAAMEHLQTYTMAKEGHLRIVPKDATGDDSWVHAYGYEDGGRREYTHAAIMDGWVTQYRGTLERMSDAWEFFEHGWRARGAVPAKVDLKHESAWVLCMGTLTWHHMYKGAVTAPHFSTGPRTLGVTPDVELAHGFKSRQDALACLETHRKFCHPDVQAAWNPRVGRRADMR